MRIAVAHSRYRSAAPSGENRVVDQETAALAALGHDVDLFERRSDDIEGWSAARKATLPAAVVWSGGARRDLRALLRASRPDVVHIHNTFPLLSASVLYACRDEGVPVVVTLHNYKLACASGDFFRDGAVCHDCASGAPLPALRHGCYRDSRAATAPVALAAVAHRRAWRTMVAAYACISAAQRELLRGVGLPADRVFVRHNMIPARAEPRSDRRPEVIYAGRLDAAKGLPVLMAGWDRYLSAVGSPGMSLVIAGSGPLEPDVRAWAASRPSVRLVGQLDPGACAAAMAAARAVVLPSAWEETFGLAAVEAMALGVAPVAAGHGAFPELITDGVDGVLFRPGDPAALAAALELADKNKGVFEEFGTHARKTYEQRFDPVESLQRLLDIYRYAIEHPIRSLPDGSGMLRRHSRGGSLNDNEAQDEYGKQRLDDGTAKYYKKDFWSTENLKYATPHFRMRKVARVVVRLAGNQESDLLDIGCGPGTLQHLMPSNVHYHGIDISIPEPAKNLLEVDILESPIDFRGMKFDFVVAQGMFEYVGDYQSQKFAEVAAVLNPGGKFVLTYQNFDHRQREVYWPYSNIQRPADFRADLKRFFRIERSFPVSHNWHHSQPNRRLMKVAQSRLNVNVPVLSPILAVDYLYVCSPLRGI